MNKMILTGNLTRDPESGRLPSGTAKATFRLANNDREKKVCYVDVVAFGRTAEVVTEFLKKGRKVLVEGRLDFQEWESRDGGRRSKHEVVADRVEFLDAKPASTASEREEPAPVTSEQGWPF